MKRGSLSHQLHVSSRSPQKRLLMTMKKKNVICKVDYTMDTRHERSQCYVLFMVVCVPFLAYLYLLAQV